jgi:hypothetical protein
VVLPTSAFQTVPVVHAADDAGLERLGHHPVRITPDAGRADYSGEWAPSTAAPVRSDDTR